MRTIWTVLVYLTAILAKTDTDFIGKHGNPQVLFVKEKVAHRGRAEVTKFHAAHGGKIMRFKHCGWTRVQLRERRADVVNDYLSCPLFDRVTFERVYHATALPNDTLYAQQWALEKIEAPAAWDKATSNDVIVAVIDTGVDYDHPDLQANLWTGPQGEHGYTAIDGRLTAGGLDDNNHGTHVAGTIAAVGNNGLGVTGINWRSRIVSLKFLTAAGSGTTTDAILCIEKMVDLKLAGHNIRVSNNSWGGEGVDAALEDAFIAAANIGILNVCAAGNAGVDVDDRSFYPAASPIDGIVSVQASDQNDGRAAFSNYGIVSTDLLAPGVGVLSSIRSNNYASFSGTSMASPHVAGALAMVFSFNPALTPLQAKTVLLHPDSYDRTTATASTTGGGRLNLRKLWNHPGVIAPLPPNRLPTITVSPGTNLIVVPPEQTVTVTASASDEDGESFTLGASAGVTLPFFLRYATIYLPLLYTSNTVRLTGKRLAIDQNVAIRFSATDHHGGGALVRLNAWTHREEAAVTDIASAVVGFRVWDNAGQVWMRLDVNTNYPFFSSVTYDARIYGGSNNRSYCCSTPNQDHRLSPNPPFTNGTYTIRPLVGDGMGNCVTGPAAVYYRNSILRPPSIRIVSTVTRGPAPLRVRADLSGSLPGDATQLIYSVFALDTGGFSSDLFNPIREFTIAEPGVYLMEFGVSDLSGELSDRVILPFTALPSLPKMLTITRSGGQVRLSWTSGVLQEATAVAGPFSDSSDQSNPQVRVASGRKFFRLR